MPKTNAAYGDRTNMIKQAVGLFATHMQRSGIMNLLAGKMPAGEAGAEATLRKQTDSHMPIVRVQDLGKKTGDELTFNLLNPVGAYPIMGSNYAEGRGTGLSLSEARLRVNQARFPVDLGNVMSQIRSPFDLRKLGRPVAQSLMDSYKDQSLLVHLCGARGFHNNIEWRIPLADHANFKEIMVNPVKAPTKNRHFTADAAGVASFTVNAGKVNIATTDMLTLDTVDAMKTVLDQIALPPTMIKVAGDRSAEDSPLRVWLMSPAQYNKFAADPAFRQFQSAALARASNANSHPLFQGDVGLWNGFIIRRMPRPIRVTSPAGWPGRWARRPRCTSSSTAAWTTARSSRSWRCTRRRMCPSSSCPCRRSTPPPCWTWGRGCGSCVRRASSSSAPAS